MYRQIGLARLTSGETIELGVVEAPDEDWVDRVAPFLVHKGGDWNWHIDLALRQPLDGLATRFYVGHLDGQPITHVMIVGARGIGILAHVYTAPRWRQRGAYRQLMAAQMDDCRHIGFQVLTLGTGFNSHPYWIYHSFGFRPIRDGRGDMLWLAEPDAGERFLAPAPATVHPSDWSDWAAYSFATLQPVHPSDALPRSPALGIKGQDSVEGPYITFRRRASRNPAVQSRVLRSASGAVVGWCHAVPGPPALGDGWILDWNVVSGFEEHRAALLDGLAWPVAPVAWLSTCDEADAMAALQGQGFRPGGSLAGFATGVDGPRDLHLWTRA